MREVQPNNPCRRRAADNQNSRNHSGWNGKVMSDLQTTARDVIERAKKDGATAADVLIREDDSFSVTVRLGAVETLKQAISRSLMLRVFVGKRTAATHTCDLTPSVLKGLVDVTVEMTR